MKVDKDKNRITCKHGTIIEWISDTEIEVILEKDDCLCKPSDFIKAYKSSGSALILTEIDSNSAVEILRKFYNEKRIAVEKMDDGLLLAHIRDIQAIIQRSEMIVKQYKAELAASIHSIEDRNKKRKAKDLKEYEIPTLLKPAKVKPAKSQEPKIDPKDKPIINLFTKLKNIDGVVNMLASLGFKEDHVRKVITDYQEVSK